MMVGVEFLSRGKGLFFYPLIYIWVDGMIDNKDEKTINMFDDIDNDFINTDFINQYKNGIVDNDTELLLQGKISQLLHLNIKYMTVADNLKLAQSIKIYKDLLESHRKNQKE